MRTKELELVEAKNVAAEARKSIPDFRAGDTVRVHSRVREGEKERVQVFEGICIRRKHGGNAATFTVRKVSYGVGVERIFPIYSPRIEKIEKLTTGDVSRARLFYLRELAGKKARVRTLERGGAVAVPGTPAEPEAAAAQEAAAPAAPATETTAAPTAVAAAAPTETPAAAPAASTTETQS